MFKLQSRIRLGLLACGIALAPALAARADGPTFAELLARATAQEAAGHRWEPPGDNMTETVIKMMDLVPQASTEQIAALSALIDHRRSESAGAPVAVASNAPAPEAVAPAVARPDAPAQGSRPDGSRAGVLFARGLEAERRGDISGARRLYMASAEQGDAAAARNLGRLYDPAYLSDEALGGIDPDPVLAEQWYRFAVHLGDMGAAPLLEALSVRQ